jgi:nuclear factor of activated T-cells 5
MSMLFFLSFNQLVGYTKPAVLQVFIGTDQGRAAPHMFYQACRVYGKNSTPCNETKINGTAVLEIALDPAKDMTAA